MEIAKLIGKSLSIAVLAIGYAIWSAYAIRDLKKRGGVRKTFNDPYLHVSTAWVMVNIMLLMTGLFIFFIWSWTK